VETRLQRCEQLEQPVERAHPAGIAMKESHSVAIVALRIPISSTTYDYARAGGVARYALERLVHLLPVQRPKRVAAPVAADGLVQPQSCAASIRSVSVSL